MRAPWFAPMHILNCSLHSCKDFSSPKSIRGRVGGGGAGGGMTCMALHQLSKGHHNNVKMQLVASCLTRDQ